MFIAIDTSTRFSSLALFDGQRLLAEEVWHSKDSHTVELMPRLVRMTESQGVKPEDLRMVAVALGPGSFTGLRIGMAVAKGLALSLDIDIVGVPTLDFMAYAFSNQRLPVWAVLSAGRGRIYTALYGRKGRRWTRLGPYMALDWEELPEKVEKRAIFCGEIDPTGVEFLQEHLGDKAVIAEPAFSLRRAGFLAQLAYQRWKAGERDDVASLSPIYLRRIGEL